MNKDFFEKNINNLIDCVKAVSEEIIKIYNSDDFDLIEKSDGSPLTTADKKANQIIIDRLKIISPDIPIISEETFNPNNLKNLKKTYWLVDPLDGTREFVNKTDEFTINIAMIHEKRPIFGIVGAPIFDKIWHGSIYENNRTSENACKKIRIVMSKSHKSTNDESFLNFLESKKIKFDILEKGSSLKLCSLSDDEADIYPRFGPTSEWDIAAAHAVLSSNGGSIIRIDNLKELGYSKESSILNPYFLAFRNKSVKNEILPLLGDFFKKLV